MKAAIKDYVVVTILGHIFLVLVLTPWLLFGVGMNREQYLTWLWQGSLIDMVLPYGMLKWIQFWRNKFKRKE
jgi:hypothetical protein